MTRVALVSHSSSIRGAEKMILNLAILLKTDQQFIPILFIPGSDGPLFDEARKFGIRYFSYPTPPWHIYKTSLRDYAEKFTVSCEALKDALIENPCELVLANTTVNLVPINVAVELDLPLLLWIHGVIDASMVEAIPEFFYLFDKWMLTTATKRLVVSKWTGEYYRGFYGIEDYSLLYNWLPEENQVSSSESKYRTGKFVCLGSHEDIKGIDILIDAAIELKNRGCYFEIDLFGDGPMRAQLVEKVNRHSLSNQVRFHGFITDDRNFFEDKLCVISSSYVDSFGLSIIEGMAQKTPAIATRSGGPDEIIKDGQTGFLIGRGDSKALADKMEFFLCNPARTQEMGEAGYQVFQEHFSEKAARSEVLSIFDDTILKFTGHGENTKFLAEAFQTLFKLISNGRSDFSSLSQNYAMMGPITKCTSLQASAAPRSSLRLQSGLVYTIYPRKNTLSGLKIMVMADKPSMPLNISMVIRSPKHHVLRKSKAILSEFGDKTCLDFYFPALHNVQNLSLTLELESENHKENIIRIFETNDYQSKAIRIYKRLVGLLGFRNQGNQLCFVEL